MSRRQWMVSTVVGLAVVCLSCCAGSCLGILLTEGLPDLAILTAQPSPTTAVLPSPTAVYEPSPTAAATKAPPPSLTPKPEPPTPTSTRVVPLVTPPALWATPPGEPFAPDDWEPDDSLGDATLIEIGETQTHNLHTAGDHDWLYFETEQGRAYVARTSNLEGEVDTVIQLHDEQGNELAQDDDGGDEYRASQVWWVARDDGRLYVMVRSFADSEHGPGTGYDISISTGEGFEVDEYEPDDSPAEASLIAVGETQTHNRHVGGDEDWILFEAQQGVVYIFETSNLGDRADTVIYLYDGGGNELAFDDDSGGDTWASRLEWAAVENGVFVVKVEDWLGISSGPGTRYDVTLTVGGEGEALTTDS